MRKKRVKSGGVLFACREPGGVAGRPFGTKRGPLERPGNKGRRYVRRRPGRSCGLLGGMLIVVSTTALVEKHDGLLRCARDRRGC